MRKLLIFALFAAGMGYAQEMPPEVKAFLDNYIKDSTARMGPLYAKSMGYFDDSTPIKDLSWRAVQTYYIKKVSLDEYPDTVALSEIIEPSQYWTVFIVAQNKPLYNIGLVNEAGQPRIATSVLRRSYPGGGLRHHLWASLLLKAYPESTGINPIYVLVVNENVMDHFLYFKQKGPRKIYYISSMGTSRMDSLRTIFPASIEKLDDSRKLVKYWREQMKISKENKINADERMKLEKANGVSKKEDNGQKVDEGINLKGSMNFDEFPKLFPDRGSK